MALCKLCLGSSLVVVETAYWLDFRLCVIVIIIIIIYHYLFYYSLLEFNEIEFIWLWCG